MENAIWNPEDDSDLESEPAISTLETMVPKPAISSTTSDSPLETEHWLFVKLLDPAAKLPTRATPGSARYNLYTCENTLIPPSTRKPINPDISISIPPGTYDRIAHKSGLSVKGLNTGAGVIDSDYRSFVKAVLINSSNTEFQINQSVTGRQW